ncbi:uncharacterized protein SPSK_09004 [Sporothrix schenckii 1099-18]|uniref:Rhodanese domain-containing protein n=1 Tax=Sporothrix schenckii 1099-18 TaxID=1397361 RepID=A0A0F2M7A4_SPOSC|nr:uncharacterized protein SPSK_09004 [Sporothrix schenckii 1099-18]KJR84715.1 hypothetical protein SPSK_09004 [Sporothrix schenckii 1099-18]
MALRTTTPQALRRRWANGLEVALVDVREEGPYADAHPLFAVTVPVSELEARLPALVPRPSVPLVVYDNGEGYAARAVPRIAALGYQDISVLEGGLAGYADVGELYRDVNVPSKAFGELVEAIRATPSAPPRDLFDALLSRPDSDVVVLDARRFEEYNTMSIPRGRSCPGGELLYRVFDAAPSPDTTVVVHCAGRTRSLIGTQSLVNAAIPNKVVALRDGTIGWTLEDLTRGGLPPLETGKTARVPPPSDDGVRRAREHAASWAAHVGVPIVQAPQLLALLAAHNADERTLYLLDVRDPSEYAVDHPAGFQSAPGGQLVQATDEWMGVRGARAVLYDTDGVRARMAASWLLQLGWEVYVFDHAAALPALPDPALTSPASVPPPPAEGAVAVAVAAQDLKALLDNNGATVVDLARSPAYRKGHIPGAWHASGPELARDLQALVRVHGQGQGDGPLVLTSPDGIVAQANLVDARDAVAPRTVLFLAGGTAAWTSAALPLEKATGTSNARWLSTPTDVYKRPYEGTGNDREAMEGYIAWEHQLVAQLANDGVANFHVVRDTRAKAKSSS